MMHSEASPAAHRRRSVRGAVSIIVGTAGTTLVVLDMVRSGDPHAAEWLVLLVPFFLGLGLLAATPAILTLRLRADGRWAQSGAMAGSLAILVNVVSRRVKQLKRGNRPLVESLEKLSAEDTAAQRS